MEKILIVEDETAYLQLLSTKLTESGYQVLEAVNGKEGLEKAKSENPDLILLDIRLPLMDGLSVLDALRQDEEGKKIKVILLTNIEPDDKIISAIMRNQPSYYFVKSDIQLNELLEKIKTLLTE